MKLTKNKQGAPVPTEISKMNKRLKQIEKIEKGLKGRVSPKDKDKTSRDKDD